MKNHFYFLSAVVLVVMITVPACSQKVEVPSQVQLALKSKFPDATKIKWSKESDTEYEAEFRLAGEETSANFSEDGVWVETEKEISKKTLPSAVQSTIDSKYADYKKGEIAFTETAEGGSFYEMELKKGKEAMILYIAADGKVVKIEAAENEGNEKVKEAKEEDEDGEIEEAENRDHGEGEGGEEVEEAGEGNHVIVLPEVVQNNFNQMFPTATKVKWDRESETEFEVEFSLSDQGVSASFAPDGKWIETEKMLTINDVPAAVKTTLDKELKGFSFDEIALTESATEGKFYEITAIKGTEKIRMNIGHDGKVIKKANKEESEENEAEEEEKEEK